MTVAEFFGCAFLAFGPAFSMFVFTVAHDPIRIIILIAAAFFWLVSLLASSLVWFALSPLFNALIVGLVASVFLQEACRYLVYRILRKTERGLQEVTENSRVIENKHILAYVSGLGFGIISGLFALVNVLADMVGPATYGLNTVANAAAGQENFFLVSAAQTLSLILLHTFWNVIFFDALDNSRYFHVIYVVISHLFISCMTLLNRQDLYEIPLTASYILTITTGLMAFKVAGGSFITFKRFITCK